MTTTLKSFSENLDEAARTMFENAWESELCISAFKAGADFGYAHGLKDAVMAHLGNLQLEAHRRKEIAEARIAELEAQLALYRDKKDEK